MMRTVFLTLVALGVPAGVYAEPTIGLMIGQHDYCGHRYVPKPVGGSFVFFDDQPIRLRLVLGLRIGNGEHTLKSVGGVQGAISATATFFPLPVEASPRGTTTEVGLRVRGDVVREGNGAEFVVPWKDELVVGPGVGYVIPVEIATTLLPGFYRIQASFAGSDEKGEAIARGVFDFEFRSATEDSAPERIRRRACSALQEGSLDEAEQEARRLLSLRPTSSEGYSLLAEAAERRSHDYRARGDAGRALVLAEEAKRNYRQQLDMQSRDSLLLKYTPAAVLEEDAEGIRRKANGQR